MAKGVTGSKASEEKPRKVEFKLSDGRSVIIEKGKGKHCINAQRIAGQDMEKYQVALIAACTKIDGKAIVYEDYLDLDAEHFIQIQTQWALINFTLDQSK